MTVGPVPDRHLGTRCQRMIDKPGSHLGYPCTLPQGHIGVPTEDPEPCYAIEVPAAVAAWQAWTRRQTEKRTGVTGAQIADSDRFVNEAESARVDRSAEVLAQLGDVAELDDAAGWVPGPNDPHEHVYEDGACKFCGNPGTDHTSATLTPDERSWLAGTPPQNEGLADGCGFEHSPASNPNCVMAPTEPMPGTALAQDGPGELRTPEQWAALDGISVVTPDGWRSPTGGIAPRDWDEPLDYDEWVLRKAQSTITRERRGVLIEEQVRPSGDPNATDIQMLVIADMKARLDHGVAKYGQGLRTFNGRSTLRDLYEELLDATVYTKALLAVADAHRSHLIDAVTQLLASFPFQNPTDVAHHNQAVQIVDRILDALVMSGEPDVAAV